VHRRWLLVVPVVVLAAGAGALGLVIARGSRTTEVSVEEAIGEFRGQVSTLVAEVSTAGNPPDSSALAVTTVPLVAPEPGVYVYASSGFDAVDALSGARHDYPTQTTVTVTAEGCGVRARWNTVRERWDEWQWCPVSGGIQTLAYRSFHEFFGTSSSAAYLCDGDLLPIPAAVGTTWRMVCRQGDTDTSTFVGRIVGTDRIDVNGAAVPALHVRYDVTVSGQSVGTKLIDRWLRTRDGLVVREVSSTDTVQSTALGNVRYQESYTMVLSSLAPQR
jgi:hypothetical protein